MKQSKNSIDNLVSRILQEEIEKRAKEVTEKFGRGEWKEIVSEELHGKQKNIDKNKNNKIDAEDFKLLKKSKAKKTETKEFFYHDSSSAGDYEGDKQAEIDAEMASAQEPTYVGKGLDDNKMKADLTNKIFGSFSDDLGWFNEKDAEHTGGFDFDYDEEEFDEFEPMFDKYGKSTNWFASGNEGKKFFNMYKDKYGPMKIRIKRDLDEEGETQEGNAFSGARQEAIDNGETSFEFEGERYPVTGSKERTNESKGKKCPKCGMINCKCNHKKETKEGKDKKWIQKTDMKKGALHKKLNVPEDEKIPQEKLKALKKELMKKAEGEKKLTSADSKLLKQVNLAMTLKGLKESKKKLRVTEEELIDMIEQIVMEQKEVAEKVKNNISDKKKAVGLKQTEKVLSKDKDENAENLKKVEAKLKDYLKKGPKADFEMNPKDFPKGMGELGETKKKAYKASDAVEEYIDNFAYPGLENTKYDEIKPNDQWLTDNLIGTSKTGNNPEWANAVKTEVGEKVNKKRIKNAYQAEKQKSYNRVTQPVDEAGEGEGESSLDKMFAKLESVEDKKSNKINEEIGKMKNLISYNQKTQ